MSWDAKRAENYDRLDWVNDDLDRVVFAACPKSTDDVLDVGTGTGAVARAIAPYVNRVHGIDVCREMFSTYRPGTTEVADILDWASGRSWDIAVMRMVLHHTQHPGSAVANVCEHLVPKNGSRIVVAEGVPPTGARAWFEKMFRLKEERHTYTVDGLIEGVLPYANIESVVVYTQPNMSINNWLENSEPDPGVRRRVWEAHVNAPCYVKEAYNMRLVGGDILMDWQTCIVVGVKE